MYDLNQLRSFITVAGEMNFRRAAKALNMTQPPLSRQIQLLEREIGVQLFDRSGRAIRLTLAGQRFLIEAEDLLRRAEAAALAARRAERASEGSVVLGFIPIAALGLLPLIIETLQEALPGVDLVLQEMQTIEQVEALPAGRIDLGIMREPRDQRLLKLTRIYRVPFVLALPRAHPLAEKEDFDLQDLTGQDYIMYSPGDGAYGYQILNKVFAARNIRPNFVQLIGQSLTILSLVNAGEGIALVPECARATVFPNVVLKPIRMPKQSMTEYYVARAKTASSNPLTDKVHQALHDRYYAGARRG